MGLLRKITRPIRKVVRKVRKIIPKEVKPFAPYIAAAFVPGAGAFGLNQGIARALVAGGTRGLIDEDADLGDIVRTGGIAALPNIIEAGGSKFLPAKTYSGADQLKMLQQTSNPALGDPGIATQSFAPQLTKAGFVEPAKLAADSEKLTGIQKLIKPVVEGAGKLTGEGNLMAKAKGIGIGGSIDAIETSLGIQESLLDDQGIKDKSDRRIKLFEYLTGLENDDGSIVYTAEEANSLLDRYGYKGFAGGGIATLRPMYAEGGIMDLGGNEMDLRGGGFVPIGKKEKADDVPARLSKNEFVMTADAVRGAGGGNINVGAKRMYDMMNQYEMMA